MSDETPDPIEIWGKRIGRTLGIIAFIVLAVLFILQLRGDK